LRGITSCNLAPMPPDSVAYVCNDGQHPSRLRLEIDSLHFRWSDHAVQISILEAGRPRPALRFPAPRLRYRDEGVPAPEDATCLRRLSRRSNLMQSDTDGPVTTIPAGRSRPPGGTEAEETRKGERKSARCSFACSWTHFASAPPQRSAPTRILSRVRLHDPIPLKKSAHRRFALHKKPQNRFSIDAFIVCTHPHYSDNHMRHMKGTWLCQHIRVRGPRASTTLC
jgi:hypothetical protein